jgi:hypothetical protein
MPATPLKPQAAFTFDVLEMFHLLTTQSKISAYDFYLSLLHRTDNSSYSNVDVGCSSLIVFGIEQAFLVSLQAITDCCEGVAPFEAVETIWPWS